MRQFLKGVGRFLLYLEQIPNQSSFKGKRTEKTTKVSMNYYSFKGIWLGTEKENQQWQEFMVSK